MLLLQVLTSACRCLFSNKIIIPRSKIRTFNDERKSLKGTYGFHGKLFIWTRLDESVQLKRQNRARVKELLDTVTN